MYVTRLASILTLALSACTMRHGMRAETLEVAQAPRGLTAEVRVGTLRFSGELLTANDSVLVIDTGAEIVRIGIDDVRQLRLIGRSGRRQRSVLGTYTNELREQRTRDLVRYMSRFPHGISPYVESKLLEERGQSQVRDVSAERGQAGSPDDFVRRARLAAARYADRRRAIEDGYRRLGPDFPFMGEHWVQPGLAVSGIVDADRPPVLTYVVADGMPILTGVAFSMPLRTDQAPPTVPAPGVWHDHTGVLNEEGFALHSVPSHENDASSRLAMLHVWTFLPNPEGVFAQDNRAVAFVRHGLSMPPGTSRVASRALTLGAGGHRYYARMIRAGVGHPDRSHLIDSLLARAGGEVDRWVNAHQRMPLHAPELEHLEDIWAKFWEAMDQVLDTAALERLRLVRSG